ncbi:MAG: YlxR family protein [Acidimicrobiales bacterium]
MGCRRKAPQVELARLVAAGDEVVVSRVAPGRGAWICSESASCLREAIRRGALARALRLPRAPEAGLLASGLPARKEHLAK